ncbi:c-type cytochrome biogenesis protein CcsB [Desulforamulus ruminis]|uniref:c-type cytochrome biogenesis protein CcsB n=1 Tax=Desulforamulus ruminis TaxID=1564 RepID=UPI0023558374|nr:c-type cytochrome biogenesis protein CcsB [Desulforamulus ruminis]
METNLTGTAYILLLIAFFLSLTSVYRPNKSNQLMPGWLITAAFIFLTLSLIARGLVAGRPPFANMYEFTLLFAWGILLFFMVIRGAVSSRLLTLLVLLLELMILSYSALLPSEAMPLIPALQSAWLAFHVLAAIIAYGAFGVSCCLGIIYLLKERDPQKKLYISLPSLDRLDDILHRSVAVGFPFMTLVLITGAVWAEEVWGSWWSWDPKETWALITWLIYASYLHARKTRGWRGRKSAVVAVVGFLVVLFTLYGVSYLLPGNHSYI